MFTEQKNNEAVTSVAVTLLNDDSLPHDLTTAGEKTPVARLISGDWINSHTLTKSLLKPIP